MSFIKGKGFIHDADAISQIAADPADARASIGSGDSFAGVNRLPLTISKPWKDSRVDDSRPPLTILLWGDSLTTGINRSDLIPNQRFNGWKLMGVDRATIVAGSAPTATDGTWIHNVYRAVAASSTVEWVPATATTQGTRANRVGVLYYKGASAANTFQLQYSQNNGGSWTNAGAAIDTSVAATDVAWFEFNLANTGLNTRVRITTSGGQTVKIIGCGAWFGDTEVFCGLGGYVLCDAFVSGASPYAAQTLANTTPTAISTPLAAMQVNMILGSWADPITAWDTGDAFDDVKTALEAGITADWVFITPNPMGPSTSTINAAYTHGEYVALIRNAMIAWAERQGQNVIDLFPRWGGNWDTALSLGMVEAGDEVHPNEAGRRYKAHLIGELLGWELLNQADALMLRRGPNGRDVTISAGAYAISFEADPANPSSMLWSFTGDLVCSGILSGASLTLSSSATIAGAIIATPNAQTATTAAVSVTTPSTAITTTAPAQAITLANGTAGQIKTIAHVASSGGGTAVLTPATKTGYTTITFTNVGETATLQFFATVGWLILSLRGAVAA